MENLSFAMNGGEGPRSYALNSSFQRSAFEAQKRLIDEAISENLDPTMTFTSSSSKDLITIADLGCSTGPNTFIAMHSITEAIKNHYRRHKLLPAHQTLEFQVFFNDQVSNDFNTLFKNLPPNRSYFACGVPGSFRGRLFPNQSLHFVHSASTLHWLSRVPKDIVDRSSSAWNKGRIHHTDAPKEVGEAYEAQFKEDLENFLNARAEEVVGNGLMALQIPAAPDVVADDNKEIDPGRVFELLGSSLIDMARVGIMTEEKVDSFNLPIFYSPVKGVKAILEENKYFSVEKMEPLNLETFYAAPNVYTFVSLYRVVMEDLIKQHFGGAIVDELFDRFTQKVVEFPDIMNLRKLKIVMLFVLLKRKL
ncbi:probable S-adenosylmethionine-dependent methyltransferase At5g37990 [Neltuma alba]|uniref:probable S-adenosylmethionine-dependent methyltransferase At5g37990 n=1 Tax=Neltuma alba TaxID=207710 RepID=UPI0010A5716D|nr:probable S-adenosylmethionine-dependent methyltransferase At5g37990 [Prosopis alba]